MEPDSATGTDEPVTEEMNEEEFNSYVIDLIKNAKHLEPAWLVAAEVQAGNEGLIQLETITLPDGLGGASFEQTIVMTQQQADFLGLRITIDATQSEEDNSEEEL